MSAARPATIAARIVALVAASVAVATAVLFVVTFSGPPPRPAPLSIAAIAHAVRTDAAPRGNEQGLEVHDEAMPPRFDGPGPPSPALRVAVAAALGRPATAVQAFGDGPAGNAGEVRGPMRVAVRIAGGWRVAETARPPFFSRWHRYTLLWMAGALAVLSLLAWGIARAITGPLAQLARAAGEAQAGAARPAFPDGGPAEVRALTGAVSAMHDRLAGHARGRVAMLAAIAHDLGTPLSRLAFWVEQLPEGARARAAADIEEMRGMIGAALAFARDDIAPEEALRVELGSLLESLADDMVATGAPVSIEAGPRAVVRGDPAALRRLFGNLIDNAIRYGNSAALAWSREERAVRVTVTDAGPGIDAAAAERLFEPFVRGDPSRNRATGGTGLGLAIARSVATRHGGAVRLANAAGGGAAATVTLPLA